MDAEVAHTSVGKRNGSVQTEHYLKEDYQRRLDAVIERINGSVEKFKFDRKSLATIIAGLQQFMEDALGVNAPNKPFLKVPAKLFRDFSPDGPLATIGRLCAELMVSKGQKRIDWANPATRKDNTSLVLRIRQELLRAGFMRHPRVFVKPDCPNASLLRHTVQKLGGELAHAEDAPGVTHVVCSYGPNGDPDDGKEYLRTLEINFGAAKVHWWYLPDSYDEWVPAAAAPAEIDPELKPPGSRPWKVYFRWVLDSEKYNEWMNELDYETEESQEENKRAREAGEGDVEEEAREKKRAKKGSHIAEVAPGALETIAPGAVTRRLLNPHPVGLNPYRVESISQGQRQEWAGAAIVSPGTNGTGAATDEYRIPAKASWFEFKSIHALEKDEFPEFFSSQDGGRTPAGYQEIRNFIISKFRQDPGRNLSFLEVRKGLSAEINDIRKIYDFLVRWSLINWRMSGRMLPASAELVSTSKMIAPTGLPGLLNINNNPTALQAAETIAAGMHAIVRPGTFRPTVPQPPAIASGVKYFCHIHPHEEISAVRYHCTKIPDMDICPAAFADGRFPPGCSARDFLRVTATEAVPDSSGWTLQEIGLLLQGQELYGDDWDKIAEHVGGRSAYQCIQKMLQIPIEDFILPPPGSKPIQLVRRVVEGNGGVGPLEIEDFPFEEVPNPVEAQISFLTQIIHQGVGAAAAQRAMEVIVQEAEKEGNADDEAMLEQPVSAETQKKATIEALAAAAAKARVLADAEQEQMQKLAMKMCENQIHRTMLKISHCDKLDGKMKDELRPIAEKAAKFEEQLQKLKKAEAGGGSGATPPSAKK